MIVLGYIFVGLLCLGYLALGFCFGVLLTMDGSPHNWFLRVLLKLYFTFLWPTYIVAPIIGLLFA